MRAKQLARYLMVLALATTTASLVRAMSPETAHLSTADQHPRITASPSEDLSIRIVDLPAWRQG